MRVVYHASFKKQYRKLPLAQRKRFATALSLFHGQPYHPELYNHPLKGRWHGHRSIAFGGDWRAHYIPKGNEEAFFVAIGTHSQLYR